MVFEDAQRPNEVIESSAGAIPLPPLGGIFAPWAGDAFHLVLGPPLTRPLAIFEPSFDVVLGLVERVLTDLVPVHDAGGHHGALELGSWGFDAEGRFLVRPGLDAPAPAGHPQESDVQAVGLIVQQLLGDDVRLRFWLRGTGAATGRVTFRDARAARQALLAVIGRRGVAEALNAWLAAVGGWLPDTRERGAVSPRRARKPTEPPARAAAAPMDDGDARRWVERELSRLREAQTAPEADRRESDPARIRIGGAEGPRAAARVAVSAASVPADAVEPIRARLAPAAVPLAEPLATLSAAIPPLTPRAADVVMPSPRLADVAVPTPRALPRLRQSATLMPVAAALDEEDTGAPWSAVRAVPMEPPAAVADAVDVPVPAAAAANVEASAVEVEDASDSVPSESAASPGVAEVAAAAEVVAATEDDGVDDPHAPVGAPDAAAAPVVVDAEARLRSVPAASAFAVPVAPPVTVAPPPPVLVAPPVAPPPMELAPPPVLVAPVAPPPLELAPPPVLVAPPVAPPPLELAPPPVLVAPVAPPPPVLVAPVAPPAFAPVAPPPLELAPPPVVVAPPAFAPVAPPPWEPNDAPVAPDRRSDDIDFLDSEPAAASAEPAWEGAVGVTGNSDRAHEKGAGKWTESGRDIGELTRQLPDGPSRPLRLDDGGAGMSSGWVVAAVIGLLVVALAVAFWPA